MTAEKRLARVTAANLEHSHLYVTGLGDFFPPEAFGGARRKNGASGGIELILDGLADAGTTVKSI